MAHFAQIEEGVVTKVIVVDNSHCTNDEGTEVEELGVQYCKSLFGESTEWKQTSYNRRVGPPPGPPRARPRFY